jgi:seryl-tRNA synthetase
MDAQASLMDRLVASGLLTPTAVDGVHARSARFEEVVDALNAMAGRAGAGEQPEKFRFPPAMVRSELARSGYLGSFPQLLGTIHCFCGDERAHRALLKCVAEGEEWATQQAPTDLLLTPAACYALYPIIARRGKLPPEGGLFDVLSWCFRHEPSPDPARMQCFRMREYVRIGSEEQALEFRRIWLERAQRFADDLRLPCAIDLANDPFFGRAGRLVADSQRDQRLKYELLIPIGHDGKPTACMSFNYHLDHFGEPWGIRQADGKVAVSACVGFGLERLALALFRHHGLEPSRWPSGVRAALRLDA